LAPPKRVHVRIVSLVSHAGHASEWYVAKDIFISGESLGVRLREAFLPNTDHMVENL